MIDQYIPGQCNIGTKEKRLRLNAAIISFLVSCLLFVAIYLFNINKLYRIVLFPTIFMSILNYLQSRHSFCVKFGLLKEYNFGDNIGVTAAIVDKESIIKDRKESIKIIIQSIILSTIIIAILVII